MEGEPFVILIIHLFSQVKKDNQDLFIGFDYIYSDYFLQVTVIEVVATIVATMATIGLVQFTHQVLLILGDVT
jgi:hypothetical protein